MKRLISLATLAALLFPVAGHSAEPVSERLEMAVEVQNFIVNFSPSGKNLGRVLAALCESCPTQTLIFDQNTLLEINGQLRPIEELKKQAEWSGVITVTNLEPEKIIKFSVY